MLLGEVKSDEQAFRQILDRLEGDVGTILQLLVGSEKTAPYWALVRMMFPIAESLGDLIHHARPTENLRSVLATQFEAVRPGYQGKAATLSLLYRHSLIHQDELRVLETGGKKIWWRVSFAMRDQHLALVRGDPDAVTIHFDTTAFYDDLIAVCHEAIAKARQWNGSVMTRYNEWLTLTLKPRKDKAAIEEIDAFWPLVKP